MSKVSIEIKELDNFLSYLASKVQDCYRYEVKLAIVRFYSDLEKSIFKDN